MKWVKDRREAAALAAADATSLIFANGGMAYAEARRRERVTLLRTENALDERRDRLHWRRVADIIAAHSA
jgi:hypothetical protein